MEEREEDERGFFLTPPPTFPFLARGEKSGGTGEMDPTVCLFPVYPDILIETSLARPRNQSRAAAGRGKEEFSRSISTPATFRFRIRLSRRLTSQYRNEEALKGNLLKRVTTLNFY